MSNPIWMFCLQPSFEPLSPANLTTVRSYLCYTCVWPVWGHICAPHHVCGQCEVISVLHIMCVASVRSYLCYTSCVWPVWGHICAPCVWPVWGHICATHHVWSWHHPQNDWHIIISWIPSSSAIMIICHFHCGRKVILANAVDTKTSGFCQSKHGFWLKFADIACLLMHLSFVSPIHLLSVSVWGPVYFAASAHVLNFQFADMTRQYKTMQTEMGVNIHHLEAELARTRARLGEI